MVGPLRRRGRRPFDAGRLWPAGPGRCRRGRRDPGPPGRAGLAAARGRPARHLGRSADDLRDDTGVAPLAMPTPRLYILCGLPFAGKTTLAGVLSDRLGLARLALDDIISEWGVGLDGRPIPAEHWAAAYNEAYRRLD